VFSQWVLGYLTEEVMIGGKEVPVASFTAAGGLVISILIALLTKTDKKPKAYSVSVHIVVVSQLTSSTRSLRSGLSCCPFFGSTSSPMNSFRSFNPSVTF
jgi:hypothetical protein